MKFPVNSLALTAANKYYFVHIGAGKMNIRIRFAEKKDAPALLEIYSYYVKNTAVSFEYEVPSVEEFENRISNTLKNYPYLVAEADGKIAGYAYASRFGVREAYDWSAETSIYIGKDFHRLGIGRKLYEQLEKILAMQNVVNVYAKIADPQKENDLHLTRDSEHFHKASGYVLAGRLTACGNKFGRWYNLITMEKALAPHAEPPVSFVPFPELNITGLE